MSSVLRLEPGDVASGMGPVGDPVPSAAPPLAVWESASQGPAGDSHLVPCPHCGVLNGRSASTCWGCEAALSKTDLFESTAAPGPAAGIAGDAVAPVELAAVRARAGGQAASPGPTRPGEARHPLVLSHPATLARRRTRAIVAAVASVGLAGLVAGAYQYINTPDFSALKVTPPPPVAAKVVGVVADPEPGASVPAAPAPPQPSNVDRPEVARPAAVANEPVRGATGPRAARPAAGALPKLDKPAAWRQRSTAPAPCTATVASLGLCAEDSAKAAAIPQPAALPRGPQPEPAAQTTAPPGPCTAAVASLGLCTVAPDQAKE